MNDTSYRRALIPGAAALALSLALTACGAANEEGDSPSGDNTDAETTLSGTLSGGGASSIEAAAAAWRAGFQSANSGVTVNYDPIGSGGGRENFISGGFEFAGSDAYFSDDEIAAATERCGGTEPLQLPAYISPIAVVYNLDGVDELRLAPETISAIFAGEITSWDDPAIAADNEGVDLPSQPIVAVHRADSSGTTENFTQYLATAGGWPHEPSGDWPITGGEAANQTSGVVSAVTNGTGTIGYTDASQAGDLGVVEVAVGGGYVGPSAEAAGRIVGASPRVDENSDTNLAVDVDYGTTEADVYPIVLVTYMFACQSYDDANTAELVEGFLSYVVGPDGQQASAESAGSAPLAEDVAEIALEAISGITG